VAAVVASRTERLRAGTAVALLPFHDPRRLAEDVATADIISRGRFDFGIGPGSQYEEFRSFGIDPADARPHLGIHRLDPACLSTGRSTIEGVCCSRRSRTPGASWPNTGPTASPTAIA